MLTFHTLITNKSKSEQKFFNRNNVGGTLSHWMFVMFAKDVTPTNVDLKSLPKSSFPSVGHCQDVLEYFEPVEFKATISLNGVIHSTRVFKDDYIPEVLSDDPYLFELVSTYPSFAFYCGLGRNKYCTYDAPTRYLTQEEISKINEAP